MPTRFIARYSVLFSYSLILIGHLSGDQPSVLDKRFELTLVAEHPQIVTPIGCTYDSAGRLLVVESHTHFPPEEYSGPKTDRIRVLTDNDGDGKAETFTTFYDGMEKTMSLRADADWVYVATRMKVFRLRDEDGDGQADKREEIAELKTSGDYPHNGLGGLAFADDNRLLFGLGENLGEPYTLVGSDGVELRGGGEGGNIYSCQRDGRQLRRLATGFWNPFGICVDPRGRIFTVGNDPDASPPCRLLHVVETGDYGYQFRFGRSGLHPLQAWNGELPGTLPMMAGTGEAPSAVVPFHGQLWVTSWGDYRIERFRLAAKGSSFTATREIVVQGDNFFRPVDFAIAPDGSLVFTDWVQKSYPVHGQGRVWRLSLKQPLAVAANEFPKITAGEQQAQTAANRLNLTDFDSNDPYLRAAAVQAAVKHESYLAHTDNWHQLATGPQRLGIMEAARWSHASDSVQQKMLSSAFNDPSPEIRLFAVRWAAEQNSQQFLPQLKELVKTNRTSLPLFQATVAAIEWLEKGKSNNATRADYLFDVLNEPDSYTPEFLVETLRNIPANRVTFEQLEVLVNHPDSSVQRAAIRNLALSELPSRKPLLEKIIEDTKQIRADAQIGLDDGAKMAPTVDDVPSAANTDAWLELVEQEPGDANAGWRVFFGQGTGRCANCHSYQGRGATIGPDLTEVTNRLDRRKLLESILQPSKEVAPRYVVTNLETIDGRSHSGLSLGVVQNGGTEEFISPSGETFSMTISEIESRVVSDRSVMPDGLEKTISVQQFRDLLALLGSVRAE